MRRREVRVDITFKAKNTDASEALRDYAGEKLQRLSRYFDQIMSVDVEFIAERNPSITKSQICEVTMFTKGATVRAVEASPDMHASIDLVTDKLERQIKRYKHKRNTNSANHKASSKTVGAAAVVAEEERPVIVRSKRVDAKPMTPEEATLQMELLGHDFFVFTNADSEDINVVYRRRDSNYGLIEPV